MLAKPPVTDAEPAPQVASTRARHPTTCLSTHDGAVSPGWPIRVPAVRKRCATRRDESALKALHLEVWMARTNNAQTARLIGNVRIQATAPSSTSVPAPVSVQRSRGLVIRVLTPAKNSTTAYRTTVST